MSRHPAAGEVAVVAVGACTPIGLTARMTQAERRSGTVGFVRTEVRDGRVAYVRERQQGAGIEEAAKELGMRTWTLSRWGSAARQAQQEPARAALVPVEVKSAHSVARAGALVVHGPVLNFTPWRG